MNPFDPPVTPINASAHVTSIFHTYSSHKKHGIQTSTILGNNNKLYRMRQKMNVLNLVEFPQLERTTEVTLRDNQATKKRVKSSLLQQQMQRLLEDLVKMQKLSITTGETPPTPTPKKRTPFRYLRRKRNPWLDDIGFGMTEVRALSAMERSVQLQTRLLATAVSQQENHPRNSRGEVNQNVTSITTNHGNDTSRRRSERRSLTRENTTYSSPVIYSPRTAKSMTSRSVHFQVDDNPSSTPSPSRRTARNTPSSQQERRPSVSSFHFSRANIADRLSSALMCRSEMQRNQRDINMRVQREATADERFLSLLKSLQPRSQIKT